MVKNYFTQFLLIVFTSTISLVGGTLFGQQQFAETISSENHVDFSSQAIDGSLLSSATINANSGLALGIGAFSGHLELEFSDEIPAYQTSYLRLDTEDDLLPYLLGGNLGELLADVAGLVLLGNQEFTVEVKNNATSILLGDSALNNAFSTNEMRVVTNSSGEYFLAVSPNLPYNRLRIANRLGSLVGLGNQKTLDVYGAFYSDQNSSCLNANYTSFEGSGITLDLIELAGAGVQNPQFAIDENPNSFSEIGLGVLGVAASMKQTFYFENVSEADDVFYVTLGVDPSLLQLGLLNNIQVTADNGSLTNVYNDLLSNLLDLDLLGLLTDSGRVEVPIRPGVPVDRISIELSSLLGVGLEQRISVYDVRNAPAVPIIDSGSENVSICTGSTANLIATTEKPVEEELLWYDDEGNLLTVLDSGEIFTTGVLTETTLFYVSSREKGCTDESPKVEVEVSVVPIPTAADIEVDTFVDGLCGTGEITLTPSSSIAGDYKWYFDVNGTNEITDNLVVGSVTYSISSDDSLVISGLQEGFDPFNVYARLIEESAFCENAAGDLKEVIISPETLDLEVTVLLDTLVSVSELLDLSLDSAITLNSEEITICAGTSIDLLATIQNDTGLEIRFYDALTGGNLLGTVDSGVSFDTGILNADTTLYLAVGRLGCILETARATILINVLDRPTAADIDVSGDGETFCSSEDVVLVPTSDINGVFEWYFDANATSPITDGLVDGAFSYSISNTGTLTISGLDEGGSPYDYFVGLEREVTGCTNVDGDLKAVSISVLDSSFNIDATLETVISVQDVIDINNLNSGIILEGSVSGDVSDGDDLILRINGNEYAGNLDSNLEYSVVVDGMDVLLDSDQQVELVMSSGLCSATIQLPLPLPELPTGDLSQVFCASDNPTLLDLQLSLEDGVLFDALVGGNVLDMDTPLVDGEVYFSGLLNLPVSVFARIAISVTVIEVDAPTTTTEFQTFCELSNPIIGDLQVDQNDVIFYDSATGGTMLDPTSPLVDGDYYVARVENGCESEDRLLINASIEEDSPITLDGKITEACISRSYTYTTVDGQENYVWSVSGGVITDGGTSTDSFATITWSELQNASIEISYVSSGTCTQNKELVQEIETVRCGEVLGAEFCLEVYNEFSPNSDGFNDFFEIECITDYVNTIRVYNRNGNVVFETQNYQNDWNGIANVSGVVNRGDHLPAGTYYYVVNIPELDRDLVGWLQLAR